MPWMSAAGAPVAAPGCVQLLAAEREKAALQRLASQPHNSMAQARAQDLQKLVRGAQDLLLNCCRA